jgi:glycosyltransferase involved in cell wall biosynthesis
VRIALLDPPGFTPPYDHALASALARRGHDVDLLTSPSALFAAAEPDGYRREEVFLPRTSRLRRSRARALLRGIEYVPSARRAVRLLEEREPDVVHVQWLGIAAYDARWLRRVARTRPAILTAHDVFPRRSWNARGWDTALRLVDRVVVHSDRAVDLLAAAGVPRERLVRIRHAVFDSAPDTDPTEPVGRTLLFFGLIRSYKGLDVLLRALPAIAAASPGTRLVVAGHSFEPVAPLQDLARELDVDGLVEWRLGYVPDADVPALFEAATVVVCPYRELDSSGVLATALGHGRPAVVSDVGSLGSIVREFGAGRVVAPEDPAALAAACAELLTDADALAAAARGARAARSALTWDAAAAEHERLYETVLAERA